MRSERPTLHPDLVRRERLLKWFSGHRTEALLAVFAPAGYGKTTLLAQAAEADERPVGWASLEDRDNDPAELSRHIGRGLQEVTAIDRAMFDESRPSESPKVVARLMEALGSIEHPVVIVLDDVHVLANEDCLEIVTALGAAVPQNAQLWLGGRGQHQFRLARQRAERQLAELGRDDLAFTNDEAAALFKAAAVEISEADLDEATRSSEGWAAGLYLTALSLRKGET
jgi:LuxR family transcriptional regulator, maltose regulon positive regulatory protein